MISLLFRGSQNEGLLTNMWTKSNINPSVLKNLISYSEEKAVALETRIQTLDSFRCRIVIINLKFCFKLQRGIFFFWKLLVLDVSHKNKLQTLFQNTEEFLYSVL